MERRTTPATKQGQSKTSSHILTRAPKQRRAVNTLAISPKSRGAIDAVTGLSNSPDIILQLRKTGYVISCELMPTRNLHVELTQAGYFCLVPMARIKTGDKA
jgi:hypothetical protein